MRRDEDRTATRPSLSLLHCQRASKKYQRVIAGVSESRESSRGTVKCRRRLSQQETTVETMLRGCCALIANRAIISRRGARARVFTIPACSPSSNCIWHDRPADLAETFEKRRDGQPTQRMALEKVWSRRVGSGAGGRTGWLGSFRSLNAFSSRARARVMHTRATLSLLLPPHECRIFTSVYLV